MSKNEHHKSCAKCNTQLDIEKLCACHIKTKTLDVKDKATIEDLKVEDLKVTDKAKLNKVKAESIKSNEITSTVVNATDVNATNVNATDVNTTNVNATDINTTNVNATDVNTTNVNATDVNTTNVTTEQVCTQTVKICTVESTYELVSETPLADAPIGTVNTNQSFELHGLKFTAAAGGPWYVEDLTNVSGTKYSGDAAGTRVIVCGYREPYSTGTPIDTVSPGDNLKSAFTIQAANANVLYNYKFKVLLRYSSESGYDFAGVSDINGGQQFSGFGTASDPYLAEEIDVLISGFSSVSVYFNKDGGYLQGVDNIYFYIKDLEFSSIESLENTEGCINIGLLPGNKLVKADANGTLSEIQTQNLDPLHGWWYSVLRGDTVTGTAKLWYIDTTPGTSVLVYTYDGPIDQPREMPSSNNPFELKRIDATTIGSDSNETDSYQLILKLQADNVTLAGYDGTQYRDGIFCLFKKLNEKPIIRPLNDISKNYLGATSDKDCSTPEFMFNEFCDYMLTESPMCNLSTQYEYYPGYLEFKKLQKKLLTTGVTYGPVNVIKIQKSGPAGPPVPITTLVCTTNPHVFITSTVTLAGFTGPLSILNGVHKVSAYTSNKMFTDTNLNFVNPGTIEYRFDIPINTSSIAADFLGYVLTPGATVTSTIGPLTTATLEFRELWNCIHEMVYSMFNHTVHGIWNNRFLPLAGTENPGSNSAEFIGTFAELQTRIRNNTVVNATVYSRNDLSGSSFYTNYIRQASASLNNSLGIDRNSYVIIDPPNPVAGRYRCNVGTLGPQKLPNNFFGNIVLANPLLADTPLTNAAAINGNIALVQRGAVNFATKVKNCQNAGAIGVIIFNSVAGSFNITGTDPTIVIPAVSITLADGMAIMNNLPATGQVSRPWCYNIPVENYMDMTPGFEPRNIWWRLTGAATNLAQSIAGLIYYNDPSIGQTFEAITHPAYAGTTPGGSGTSQYYQMGNNIRNNYNYPLAESYIFARLNPSLTNGRKIGYIRIYDELYQDPLFLTFNGHFAPKPPAFPIDTTVNNPRTNIEAMIRILSAGMQYIITTLECTDVIIDYRDNTGGYGILNAVLTSFFGGNRTGEENGLMIPIDNGFGQIIDMKQYEYYNNAYESVINTTKDFLPDLTESYYPGSVLKNGKLILLADRNAASAGDYLPHFFLGDTLNRDLGNGVKAKILGDINGILTGSAGHEPGQTVSYDSFIITDNSNIPVSVLTHGQENGINGIYKMKAETIGTGNRMLDINPDTGLPPLHPDAGPNLGSGPWINTWEALTFPDIGYPYVADPAPSSAVPRLPGDTRLNPGPLLPFPNSPSHADRARWRDSWLEESVHTILAP